MSKNKLKPDVYRPIITKPVIIDPKAEPQISTILKKREGIYHLDISQR